jgi:hypothetical protein
MTAKSFAVRLLFVAGLVIILGSLPASVEAGTSCPGDDVIFTTPGSTVYGATCNDAYLNLGTQERSMMNCPYGVYEDQIHHNGCYWNGSTYQVTGWFYYECQTDCVGDP